MDNKLNITKIEYKAGDVMWVHWDNKKTTYDVEVGMNPLCERLLTTIGYLMYMDDKVIILSRSICSTEEHELGNDMIQIPMSYVASYGSLG